MSFKKHGAVQSVFAQKFVKTGLFEAKYHRWLLKAFNQGQAGDYDEMVQFKGSDVKETLGQAREFLEVVKKYLGS